MALILIAVLLAAVVGVGRAQSTEDKKPTAAAHSSSSTGSASNTDAARVIRERRARARLLLITLASDARSFRDQTSARARLHALPMRYGMQTLNVAANFSAKRGKPLKW